MNTPSGLLEGIGNATGWKGLENWAKVNTWNHELGSQKRASTTGFGDVRKVWSEDDVNVWNGITTTTSALANTLAGSAPQMLLMMTPFVGAPLSAAAYVGDFYHKQGPDEKDFALAVGMGIPAAVLDKLGLDALLGSKFLTNAADRKLVVEALKAKSGDAMTDAAAEKILEQASKRTIMEFAGWSKDIASRQATNWRGAAGKAVGGGAIIEAGTETIQQALEILSQGKVDLTSMESILQQRFDKKTTDQLLDAAMGGAALGGTLRAVTSQIDHMAWMGVRDSLDRTALKLQEGQQLQTLLRREADMRGMDPKLVNVDTQLEQAAYDAASLRTPVGEDSFSKLEGAAGGLVSAAKRTLMDPVSLLRSLAETTIPSIFRPDGSVLLNKARIKAILAPGILTGDHYDGFRQRIVQAWNFPSQTAAATVLKVPTAVVNDLVKSGWDKAWKEGNMLAPGEVMHKGVDKSAELNDWWKLLQQRTGELNDLLNSRGLNPADYNTDPSTLFGLVAANPITLRNNRTRLVEAMMQRDSDMLASDARGHVENLISPNPERARAGYEALDRLGIPTSPDFSDVFAADFYDSLENHKASVANAAARDKYIGRNGEVLARLIALADRHEEWASPKDRAETIKNLKDWVAITEGDYHSLQDRPTLQKGLAWWMTATMLAVMPKAMLSSIPEIAFASLGTDGPKVYSQFRKNTAELLKGLGDHLQEGASWAGNFMGLSMLARSDPDGRLQRKADNLWDEYNKPSTTLEQKEKMLEEVNALYEKETGRSLHAMLGYADSGYNVQAKYELQDLKARRVMQMFVKIIGLQAHTDAVRVAALHMGADIMMTHLMNLQSAILSGKDPVNNPLGLNQFEAESHRMLTSYGGDIGGMMKVMEDFRSATDADFDLLMKAFVFGDKPNTNVFDSIADAQERAAIQERWPQMKQIVTDNFSTVLRNMIDSKIANPQTSNMPKFIHDPRLRAVTVMMRFMTAFTANVLPNIYRNYIIDGSRQMRVQAATTIAASLALGVLANAMKDLISYGDDENPYLKGYIKETQRAIYAAGLLGNLQGPIDKFVPLYDFARKPDPNASLPEQAAMAGWEAAKSSSAPLSWASNLLGGLRDVTLAKDDKQEARGVSSLLKATPMLGGFPAARWAVTDEFKKSQQGE
jgi:hypothetical protein